MESASISDSSCSEQHWCGGRWTISEKQRQHAVVRQCRCCGKSQCALSLRAPRPASVELPVAAQHHCNTELVASVLWGAVRHYGEVQQRSRVDVTARC